QHQGSTPILADDVDRILADIDADHGDFAVEFLGHGVLLCLRCPLPVWLAGRAGARPDHPILGPPLLTHALCRRAKAGPARCPLEAIGPPTIPLTGPQQSAKLLPVPAAWLVWPFGGRCDRAAGS